MSDFAHAGAGIVSKLLTSLVITSGLAMMSVSARGAELVTVDPQTVGLAADRLKRIETVIKGYVDDGRIPGAVYAIARRGKLAHINTLGPMREDSIFRFFSMTKPITTVAVLQQYEQGKFLLTDPIAHYLPEFSRMQVYVEGQDARPAARLITIEDLLTHTAGLTYNDATVEGVPLLYEQAELWSSATLAEFTEKVAALPLVFDPGTRWHYSVATDVLGRLVEVTAEQAFDDYLAEHILGPLQMRDTAFFVPESGIDRFVPLYRKDGEGMTLAESVADSSYLDKGRVPYGGAGLVSTAGDYLRFMQMLLNNGELDGARLLGTKTVDLMMMDHLGADFERPRLGDPWLGVTENRSGDMNLGFGHGYGGYVIVDVAENDVPGSVGTYSWGGAASTYFFVDRSEQLAAIFLTQLGPSTSYPLRAQFRGLVYQAVVD